MGFDKTWALTQFRMDGSQTFEWSPHHHQRKEAPKSGDAHCSDDISTAVLLQSLGLFGPSLVKHRNPKLAQLRPVGPVGRFRGFHHGKSARLAQDWAGPARRRPCTPAERPGHQAIPTDCDGFKPESVDGNQRIHKKTTKLTCA